VALRRAGEKDGREKKVLSARPRAPGSRGEKHRSEGLARLDRNAKSLAELQIDSARYIWDLAEQELLFYLVQLGGLEPPTS
jgi:hypothetical protein